LDHILHGFDLLLNIVGGDLVVLDGGTDDDLEDTVSDGFLLVLGLPEEAVHLDGKDHLCHLVDVGLLTPGLDFPDDDGLGNSGLLAVRLGGLGEFLESSLLFLFGFLIFL